MRADKPSNTALIVAAGLQLARPIPAAAPLLPIEAIRRGADLLRAAHPRMAGLLRQSWFHTLCRVMERATLPGMTLHIALRKRAIRDHAHAAVATGCRQVVVLGAGLNTLCMELLAAYPQLCCIEVDLPATQQRKRRAAGAAGQGVHYLGADLAQQPFGAVLAACPAFHAELPTLFVAEGLLMYVPLPAVAALFAQMAAAAPHSQVAFTWFEPQADGRPNFRDRSRLVDLWLALRGEPFLSGMARADLPGFLQGAGYAIERVLESADLLGQAQRSALPVAAEYICFARRRAAADT